DSYRSDVAVALVSDGFHGFELYTGRAIPDGAPVECHIANTDVVLENSPIAMCVAGVARPHSAGSEAGRAYVRDLIYGAYHALLQRAPGDSEVASQVGR